MDMMEYNTKVIDAIFAKLAPPPKRRDPEIIIGLAYQDGMESLATDGYCCADLMAQMGEFSRYEVLTETDSDAIFKSLDRAMRNGTEANYQALGKLLCDEAKAYIAKTYAREEDAVRNDSSWRP